MKPRQIPAIGGVLAMAGWVGVALAGSESSPHRSAAPPLEIAQLIEQLGDKSYLVRERASRRLAKLGLEARDALDAATSNSDREIRVRAYQTLNVILDQDFERRLEAFAGDADRNAGHGLAGWQMYQTLLGEKASRDLFVAMQRSEPELMASLEGDLSTVTQTLMEACIAADRDRNWRDQGSEQDDPDSGPVAALVIAGVMNEAKVSEETAGRIVRAIDRRLKDHERMEHLEGAPMRDLRRLVGLWILKDRGSVAAIYNLRLAMMHDFEEGRQLAIDSLSAEGKPSNLREIALLAIGKLGNRSDIRLVESCLEDTSVPPENGARGQASPVQIRDVALVVLLHLTEQNPSDYGYLHLQADSSTVYRAASASFETAAAREAALRRWREWSAAHPE